MCPGVCAWTRRNLRQPHRGTRASARTQRRPARFPHLRGLCCYCRAHAASRRRRQRIGARCSNLGRITAFALSHCLPHYRARRCTGRRGVCSAFGGRAWAATGVALAFQRGQAWRTRAPHLRTSLSPRTYFRITLRRRCAPLAKSALAAGAKKDQTGATGTCAPYALLAAAGTSRRRGAMVARCRAGWREERRLGRDKHVKIWRQWRGGGRGGIIVKSSGDAAVRNYSAASHGKAQAHALRLAGRGGRSAQGVTVDDVAWWRVSARGRLARKREITLLTIHHTPARLRLRAAALCACGAPRRAPRCCLLTAANGGDVAGSARGDAQA